MLCAIAMVLLGLCPGILTAQTSDADSTAYFDPDTGKAAEHYEKMSRRAATTRVNMEGYVGGRKNNTAWGFNANAEVTAPVGKKADITAGVTVMQSYYNGADFIPWSIITNGLPSRSGRTTDAIVYVAGSYYPTSRLTLHAAGFVNLTDSGNPFVPRKGFSFGADYRISRRAMISFHASYIDGGYPYPFGYGYYNGFSPSGFHPGVLFRRWVGNVFLSTNHSQHSLDAAAINFEFITPNHQEHRPVTWVGRLLLHHLLLNL